MPAETLQMILMIVVMIAVFYFLLIRPENKRKKKTQEMRDALSVGDAITTIGGIYGTIVAVKNEDTIVIETGADRVRLEMAKWAVNSRGAQSAEDEVVTEDEAEGKKK